MTHVKLKPDHMSLEQANRSRLEEIILLLDQIPSQLYAEPQGVLSASTIGQHFRHIIEFYICLHQGHSSSLINYDERKRDLRIETDQNFAKKCCIDFIQFLDECEGDRPLTLLADMSAQNSVPTALPTSFYRELAYVMDHAVHHLAIIKIALSQAQVTVDEHIGVAASTLRFRAECAQ
jgi:uncharacterized damage-inducible protein DinB